MVDAICRALGGGGVDGAGAVIAVGIVRDIARRCAAHGLAGLRVSKSIGIGVCIEGGSVDSIGVGDVVAVVVDAITDLGCDWIDVDMAIVAVDSVKFGLKGRSLISGEWWRTTRKTAT